MPVREDLFVHTINSLNVGKVARDASLKLNELVNKCRETSQKGSISLTLTIIPDKAGQGQYVVKPKLDIKKPEHPLPETFMWGTPDGNLQTHHPDQGNLELKVVPENQESVKVISE